MSYVDTIFRFKGETA
jgi:uncharacterized ferritin-like protein (DUF455 family)